MINVNNRIYSLFVIMFYTIIIMIPAHIPYRILSLCFLSIFLSFFTKEGISYLGFKKRSILRVLLWSILLTILNIILGKFISPFIDYLMSKPVNLESYGSLKGNTHAALQLWFFALISAAIGEEIVFRGFMLQNIKNIFGDSRYSSFLSCLACSVIFGLAHSFQGISGIILTGIVGFLFSIYFLYIKKDIYSLIIAHALTDTIGILGLYFGISF